MRAKQFQALYDNLTNALSPGDARSMPRKLWLLQVKLLTSDRWLQVASFDDSDAAKNKFDEYDINLFEVRVLEYELADIHGN